MRCAGDDDEEEAAAASGTATLRPPPRPPHRHAARRHRRCRRATHSAATTTAHAGASATTAATLRRAVRSAVSASDAAVVTTRGGGTAATSSSSSLLLYDDALQHRTRQLQQCVRALSTFSRAVPAVVRLRVDGRVFAVQRQLLMRDAQSLLFALVERHYRRVARQRRRQQRRLLALLHKQPHHDAAATTATTTTTTTTAATSTSLSLQRAPPPPVDVPHRNADVFARLLNVLRGYRHAVTPAWRDACRREAAYYGLHASWRAHAAAHGTATAAAADYAFRAPAYGARLYADMVCCFASDALRRGVHVIHFAITQSERVAVGVMRSDVDGRTHDGDDLRQLCGSALYWNDGRVTTCFATSSSSTAAAAATAATTTTSSPPPQPHTLDTGWPYPSPVVVRVVYDADAALVRWLLSDDCCVAVQRLPRIDAANARNNNNNSSSRSGRDTTATIGRHHDNNDNDNHATSSSSTDVTYAFFVVAARNSHVSIVTPP